MSLLDLAIKVGVDDQATNGLKQIANSAKSGLGVAFKAGAAAVTAATTAVVALTKKSVDAYADYEQLVGGIETLYGAQGMSLQEYAENAGKTIKSISQEWVNYEKAQSTVLKNANDAWLKQGMDANTYMNTAMSFSSALINSLEGDTVKAAAITDRVMTDIADNANKFGSSTESVMNAYMGFAKSNYTMLDNLKLGYAGTKEGAEQLIKAASQMKDVQAELGVTIDENSLDFANLANAISVVQQSMGISGTTMQEAMHTISGSMNAFKAAWQNLLIGLGDDTADLGALVGNLVTALVGDDSGGGLLNNLLPRVQQILSGMGQAILGIAPIITQLLPQLISEGLPMFVEAISSLVTAASSVMPLLVETIVALAPQIIEAGILLISSFASAFMDSLPAVLDALQTLLTMLVEFITANAGAMVEGAVALITALAGFIADNIDLIIDGAIAIIIALGTALSDNAPQLAAAAGKLMLALVNALIAKVTDLVSAVGAIIKAIVSGLTGKSGEIESTGGELIISLVNGLFGAIGKVTDIILEIDTEIINGLLSVIGSIASVAADIIDTLIEGISAKFPEVGSTLSTLWEGAKSNITSLYDKGVNAVNGMLDGIKSVWGTLSSWVSSAWAGITSMFHATATVSGGSVNVAGSHAKGYRYVAEDDIYQLHKGEMVLTRTEADKYRNGEEERNSGGVVNIYAQTINKTDLDMVWDYVNLQGGMA